MNLTVTKIQPGGVSTINKVTPCAICNRYTDESTSPLVDVHLWLTTPRGGTTHGARLAVHVACLQSYITHANDVLEKRKKFLPTPKARENFSPGVTVKEAIERLSANPGGDLLVRIYTATQAYAVAEVQPPSADHIRAMGNNTCLDVWLPDGMYVAARKGGAS